MLTADNARKLVDDYNRQQLEKIHQKIKNHAEIGFDFLDVPCHEMNEYSKQALIQEGYAIIGPSFGEYTIRW